MKLDKSPKKNPIKKGRKSSNVVDKRGKDISAKEYMSSKYAETTPVVPFDMMPHPDRMDIPLGRYKTIRVKKDNPKSNEKMSSKKSLKDQDKKKKAKPKSKK